MSCQELDDVTGVGKFITIRNKEAGIPFTVGLIEDEVSQSNGKQKYFVQWVRLQPNVSVAGDGTRYILRIGYYTRRTDGRLCLGSQFTPMLTRSELRDLVALLGKKEWFN